ncbi:hypothetical protein I3271_06915 [Photobacterium leiognathi]|uniref:hypothetical protein n=1 Tax=Photobacterium leiognathi TaxID=553611 RepID=UPI001EDFE246|nr:hypothetical protein [Photobacterium leiognathi]MCG3884416.1 hypothetical protein [Photobacterium leiognathi]
MKKVMFTAALLSASVGASAAVPGFWTDGFAQGYEVYSVANTAKQTLTITCAAGTGAGIESSIDNSVVLTSGTKMYDSGLSFVIDSDVYVVPTDTFTTDDDSWAWNNFIDAISSSDSFKVYSNSNEIGKFKVNLKNTIKTFKHANCVSKRDWIDNA